MIEGTAIAVDDQGIEHASEDGMFWLCVWRPGDWTSESVESVEVHEGRWSAYVPRDREWSHVGLVLRGHVVDVDDKFIQTRRPTDSVALRGHWPARLLLHVRDEATRAELPSFDIANVQPPHADLVGVAGQGNLEYGAMTDCKSPTEIWPRQRPEHSKYWISAPDHDARTVELEFRSFQELTVELPTNTGLDVSVQGWVEWCGGEIVARKSDGEELVSTAAPNADGRARLIGLIPGRYDVALTFPSFAHAGAKFGSVSAEVRHGMIESITLDAHIPPKPEHTDFAGELVANAAWDAERFHCELKLLDPALYWATRSCGFPLGPGEDLGDGRRLYRWKVWDMQVGRYEFRIESARFCRTFELSKGGQCTLELAAPTVVRIVDDMSRETRKIPDLVLRTNDSADVIERLPMAIRGGEFLAPVGDWLAVQTPTFSKTVLLVPGMNEIAVPMPSH